jgi:hypothetical protein
MPIGRASCSLSTRLGGEPLRPGHLHSSRSSPGGRVPRGCGPLSRSLSSRTLLTYFLASCLNRSRKYMFFVPSAHFGSRRRYSMPCPIRAKCRSGCRDITMTFRVCTGTSMGRLRSRTSGCLQVSSNIRKNSSGKPQHGTIWPGPEAFACVSSHVAQIRSDYRDMREMFFREAPPFDQVIADLQELEDRVNA